MIVPLKSTARPADTADADQAIGMPRRHPYQRFAADRRAAAPHLDVEHLHLLTSSAGRRSAGNGDLRPVVIRTGADQAAQYPSRSGHRLTWPDGRITTLDGEAIEV